MQKAVKFLKLIGFITAILLLFGFSGCDLLGVDDENNKPVKTAAPAFTPETGTYDVFQSATITCATEGAEIYYTTNGETPTTNSFLYSTSINLYSTITLKAIAVKEGMERCTKSKTNNKCD